jgi:hypothetical protein
MLEMRDILNKWQYKLDMATNMLAFRELNQRKANGELIFSNPTNETDRATTIANQTRILK